MVCNRCRATLNQGDLFCGSCGLSTANPDLQTTSQHSQAADGVPSGGEGFFQRDIAVRVVSAVLLIGGLLFCFFLQSGWTWFVVFSPAFAGLLLLVLQLKSLLEWLDRVGRFLLARKSRADGATGKLARFVRRPFCTCVAGVWNVSKPIENPYVRAAIRLSVSLYVVVLFLFIFLLAAYLIIAVAALLVTLAVVGRVLSPKDSKKPAGSSERTRNWHGEQYTVNRDAQGRKTGESWERTGMLGEKYVEHRDAAGRKIGESRSERGFFGDEVVVERDAHGAKTGIVREEEVAFGDAKQVRFDNRGNWIGESRRSEGFGGQEVVEHFTEDGDETNKES